MIITAKFSSTCPNCSKSISVGSKVEWERGAKAKHASCVGEAGLSTSAASAVAASVSVPTGSGSTVTRTITVERVGRRSYLRGDTYAVRGMLRDAGCHWDSDSKIWWIGDAAKATELAAKAAKAAKAATVPAERPSSPAPGPSYARRSYSGRGTWNGCSCGAREYADGSMSANACASCQHDAS